MTVMQFDSHVGWYNPAAPLRSSRSFCLPPRSALPRDPRSIPIESRCFFVLLDDARAGCAASRSELALRGQTTSPRVPLASE
jgi:hypothetical protein